MTYKIEDIDWSKMPEGATEFSLEDEDYWFTWYDDNNYYMSNALKKWQNDYVDDGRKRYKVSDYHQSNINGKMSKEEMFSDAKIGYKVWDFQKGWGVIVNLDFSSYPITVDFPDGAVISYTLSGYEYLDDVNPSLFWDVVSFGIPSKPPVRDEE